MIRIMHVLCTGNNCVEQEHFALRMSETDNNGIIYSMCRFLLYLFHTYLSNWRWSSHVVEDDAPIRRRSSKKVHLNQQFKSRIKVQEIVVDYCKRKINIILADYWFVRAKQRGFACVSLCHKMPWISIKRALTHSDFHFRNQNVPEGAIFFFWNQYSNIVREKFSN